MPETLVFQSYRTNDVPPWLSACMSSVERWAALRGYAYERLGDEFFDPVPRHLGLLDLPQKLPATDLARLLWCRDYLARGWSRVVWADADILVIDPETLTLPDAPQVLCRELWVWQDEGQVHGRWSVNNCFMAYRQGDDFLPRYIEACEEIAAATGADRKHTALGPSFLTPYHEVSPLPQIDTVATLSPWMIRAVLAKDLGLVQSFRDLWAAPIHAVHLCRNLATEEGGGEIREGWHDAVVAAFATHLPAA